MTNKPIVNGYDIRKVRYEQVHCVSPRDFDALANALDIQEGQVVGDLCAGYGAVTRELLVRANKDVNFNPILVDRSPEQIFRSYQELPQKNISRVIADIRHLPFRDNYFDRLAMKMGLHELPLAEQQGAVNEICRTLKPNGIFAVWNVLAKDEIEQAIFQNIIREKDRLAGFESMSQDRYLQREDEIYSLLGNAGFSEVRKVWDITYHLSTANRLDAEFGGDSNKLEKWNDFIRKYFPHNFRTRFGYVDDGRSITMTFNQGIIRGVKPKLDDKGRNT